MMFLKQKRFIDLFIDLIYWFEIFFFTQEVFMNVPQIQSEKTAASAAWWRVRLSRQLWVKRIWRRMIFAVEIYYTAQHCSESIMMTNQDRMKIRVVKDICRVNTVRKKKIPCNYSCFIFPPTVEYHRIKIGEWWGRHAKYAKSIMHFSLNRYPYSIHLCYKWIKQYNLQII